MEKLHFFSLIFDFTLDISHKDQLNQIIRYDTKVNNELEIEETFIDFIITNGNIELGIDTDIFKKLEVDELNFKNYWK